SIGCYSGDSIHKVDFKNTNAIYASSPGTTNRSYYFINSFQGYIKNKNQSYDFNDDKKTTIDEAFAYAADQASYETSPFTLIYHQPMSLNGVEGMGPWHRKNEKGE